jgi:hypothetical protein|tara:strand:+ start:908 stop:1372 length:465 start_codon:yes stop_codon:yes gene_type:complete
MALNIVTGKGPRVGSSFVMQQCKAQGLPVQGDGFLDGFLPVEGNPNGYYDIWPWDVQKLTSGVAKVWPTSLQYLTVPVHRMIILERKDTTKQIESCVKQMEREPLEFTLEAEEIIGLADVTLQEWLLNNKVESRLYYTEELDFNINKIIKFLGE